MNRAKRTARQRRKGMGFDEVPLSPNQETNLNRTQVEPESNQLSSIVRTTVEPILKNADRVDGRYTAVAVSKLVDVSDTAVRKAFKALKQAVSESFLVVGGKYTELCKSLMVAYFQRPDEMNGAEWINELQSIVGAIPDAVVSDPAPNSADYWKQRQQELGKQSSALATRSQALLAYVQEQTDLDELGSDDAFDAELQSLEEEAYEKELRRQIALIEGRNRARQDIKQNI